MNKDNVSRENSSASVPLPSLDDPTPSNREVLQQLYLSMLKCRIVAEKLRDGAAGKLVSSTAPVMGGEAVLVGTTFGLKPADKIVADGRLPWIRLAKGADPKSVIQRLVAVRNGAGLLDDASDASELLRDGNRGIELLNLATGLAHACKLQNNAGVVVTFASAPSAVEACGDALQAAEKNRLPILYVMESHGNQTAESLPGKPLSLSYERYGFPSIAVDGDDVVAIWRVAHESLLRARRGCGPTLIECRRTGGSKKSEEISSTERISNSALGRMEHHMRKRNAWNADWQKGALVDWIAEVESAVRLLPKP